MIMGVIRLRYVAVAFAVLALVACGATDGAAQSKAAWRLGHGLLVDALGDTFPAGPFPARIVSLSPNLTEMLFAAGVDSSRIVGVTRYCDFPPEAKLRPIVGGIVDPSIEQIRMQRPDVVLAARGNPKELLDRIRAMGIPVYAFDDRTDLEGVRRMIVQMVALTGPENAAAADSLQQRFWRELRAYKSWSDAIPETERPRVYYADPEHPGWTAGPGSHVDDLIRRAGGRNVVTEGDAWPQYSAEALLLAQPDLLVLAIPPGAERGKVLAGLSRMPGWSKLRAVRERRICWIDAERLLRPGPRILSALEQAAACIQPERSRPSPDASGR